jgi:hypothetical protein
VPISILDQVDKYRKHCLWDKGDVNRKSGCLVAWKKATHPKNQGGLGIELTILHCCSNFFINSTIDSTSHGTLDLEYLLLKADPSSSQKQSGSFWWRDIMSISDHFFMVASCSTQEGNTIYF